MSANQTIRQAVADDVATLVELRDLMLREMGADDEDRLESLRAVSVPWIVSAIENGRAAGWLAEADGEVLGGATMTLLQLQPQLNAQNGSLAQIYGLYVYPPHRGNGIATEIVNTAVAYARERGCALATLHAAPKARPLYERIGFEASSEMRLFLR